MQHITEGKKHTMDTLFKYTSLLPIEYFDAPTIKISTTEFLNDPFESDASDNILLSLKNHLKENGVSDEGIADLSPIFDTTIKLIIAVNGVVSLSETPRNSLMWAHYAKQHHGMCIGYKNDFLEHVKNKNENADIYLININKPQKVNYDNLRFEIDYCYPDLQNMDVDAAVRHLFKKSDEWIYEKEHRCIIPYINANKLIILNDNPKIDCINWPDHDPNDVNVGMSLRPKIKESIERGYIKKTKTKNHYIINNDTIDPSHCTYLQSSKDSMFLVDIKKESIDSIYFGCKVPNETIKFYYEKLHKRYKLYKFTLSKKRFELIPKPVTADMFN